MILCNKINKIKVSLSELNYKYYEKELLTESFYSQLKSKGIFPENSMLIDLYPDSSNTYIVDIITKDMKIIKLDLDLDSPDHTICEDITKEYMKKAKKLNSKEHIALELYKEVHPLV